jgi:RluA family pseudouridine synthase
MKFGHAKSQLQPEVLHDQPSWIVINKPSGLDSQASKDNRGSVAEWLEDKYGFAGLVHRLDFGTSGLMVCAKTPESARKLTDLMKQGRIKRVYKCLCIGLLEQDSGAIESDIQGKKCKTFFRVLERFKNASLVECTLESGRKHQIRIHMHSLSHPIIGDHRYKAKGSHLLLKRPALHSWQISIDGEVFQCELPKDMEDLLQRFRKSQTDRSI